MQKDYGFPRYNDQVRTQVPVVNSDAGMGNSVSLLREQQSAAPVKPAAMLAPVPAAARATSAVHKPVDKPEINKSVVELALENAGVNKKKQRPPKDAEKG